MPPVLTKKREKTRRLDNAVVQSLFVTTTAGQYGGTNSGGTRTTWNGNRPDAGRLSTRLIALSSSYRHSAKRSEIGKPMEIERQWLCFSPTMKKPSCQRCWLFGDPSAMQKEWANDVSRKPKNFGVKIKSILHDVLGHTCPSMVRYQLIMFNNVRV